MNCNVRVFSEWYSDEERLNLFEQSAENASFPATNTLKGKRRGKVWRTGVNYYEIDYTNRVIAFREEIAGPTLYATIAMGGYNASGLHAAITAAMNAASPSGTIYSASSTITSQYQLNKSSGPSSVFYLMFTDPLAAGFASDFKFTATDYTSAPPHRGAPRFFHIKDWVRFDMGIPTNPRAVIVIGKSSQPMQLSEQAVVTVKGNASNNFIAAATLYSQSIAFNDNVMILTSDTGLHTEPLRYWQVEVKDGTNPDQYIELSKVFVGDYLDFERGKVQFPLDHQLRDLSVTVSSESGVTYSYKKPQFSQFSLSWNALTKADVDQMMQEVWNQYGTHSPFFIELDPMSAFSTSRDKYVKLVKFNSEPSIQLTDPNYFSVTWSLREEL